MVVDTLGHLLALQVAPADVSDRATVGRLCADAELSEVIAPSYLSPY